MTIINYEAWPAYPRRPHALPESSRVEIHLLDSDCESSAKPHYWWTVTASAIRTSLTIRSCSACKP